MIFNKGGKQFDGEEFFNTWWWDNTQRAISFAPSITLQTKINSKCIKYLNVKAKTITLRRKHKL